MENEPLAIEVEYFIHKLHDTIEKYVYISLQNCTRNYESTMVKYLSFYRNENKTQSKLITELFDVI